MSFVLQSLLGSINHFISVFSDGTILCYGEIVAISGSKYPYLESKDFGVSFSWGYDSTDIVRYDPWFLLGECGHKLLNEKFQNYYTYRYTNHGIVLKYPLFDGDIGVLVGEDWEHGFIYLITVDGGNTWVIYDPEDFADITKEEVEETYEYYIIK